MVSAAVDGTNIDNRINAFGLVLSNPVFTINETTVIADISRTYEKMQNKKIKRWYKNMKNLQYTIRTKLGDYTIYTPDDINIDMVVKEGVDRYQSARELPLVVKKIIKGMGFKLNLYNAKKLNKMFGLANK